MNGRVVVVGEAVWDLFADVPGARLSSWRRHVRHIGGVEANLASTLARLGVPVELVTTLGADPLGDGLADALVHDGVVLRARRLPLRTPIVFVDVAPDGARRFVPYRAGTADGALGAEDLDPLALAGASWLHLSGSAAASATARAPAEALIARAQALGVRVSLDVNARPWQWPEPRIACETLERWLACVDLAKASDEDLRALGFGEDTPALERLFALRAGRSHGVVIVTRGARGALARVGDETIEVAGRARFAIDATGAGDAFMAGVLARLRRTPLEDVAALAEALRVADRLARDVVGHLGARPSGAAVRAARRAL
jgi:sugar/nucleoside kinase (ribokinase family)